MDRFLHLNLSFLRRRMTRSILAFVWTVGLILGAVASLSADILLASTMHAAVRSSMSIFGLLTVLLLPLIISTLVVYVSQPRLLIPVVFLKAFLFAYTWIGIMTAFDSAGWLLRGLLMFSDSLILPLLWWFWLRSVSGDRCAAFQSAVICIVCVAAIGCFDYALVVPFLARLI